MKNPLSPVCKDPPTDMSLTYNTSNLSQDITYPREAETKGVFLMCKQITKEVSTCKAM